MTINKNIWIDFFCVKLKKITKKINRTNNFFRIRIAYFLKLILFFFKKKNYFVLKIKIFF